ncbi:EAL domain-containing protein [Nakamurella sp. YIM 132087]|uniref:EAL domain-containing protein n=1 Tax=Nakamurella alba TaxID=2665158 RepID=A0A7K1FTJ8_9ACTN|nr:EAL domain-containing protein [Nakamurella alba]MTD17496.1 EAL domain-containing protein [Nakamurella alba]
MTMEMAPLPGGRGLDGASAAGGDEHLVEQLLDLARLHLDMDLAWVSRFTNTTQVVEAASGDLGRDKVEAGYAAPLEGSYCVRVVNGTLPAVIPNALANPTTAALDITHQLGIGAYVAVPLRQDGRQIYGTLCCFASAARPDLGAAQLRFMEFLAAMMTHVLRSGHEAQRAHDRDLETVHRVIADGQLQIALQPIFGPSAAAPVAFEALARFPSSGWSTEQWFIVANRIGAGVDLELAALAQALHAFKSIHAAAYLTVNLSPGALDDPRLPSLLVGHPCGRLIIEVTEHEQVDDYPRLRRNLAALRRRGVKVAVDDAGSGYAGMRHLVELAPDLIKMDFHLTHNIDRDPARQAMATALVAFAASTGAALLAEGVETADELQAVRELGIPYVQGFLLGLPVLVSSTTER